MASWLIGSIFSILGIFGTVLAANAVDAGMYSFGLGLLAFGVLIDFWLIKDHFDMEERGATGN